MEIIFASNNNGKIIEIQSLITKNIKIISLRDAGITEAIEEPFFTFAENAKAKADHVYRKTGMPCMAEDSGLVVPALDGAPGVLSARYAGEPSNDESNNYKLLNAISKMESPKAYYQSVICFIFHGEVRFFEGKCDGRLTKNPRGEGGFGYDPLFIPDGYEQTFAELSLEAKNKISHRGKAMRQFIDHIHHLEQQ